ncbi:hypothetical protein PR048_022221 [Dryococelus australis]|uniref:Uncharacterized protein n=1 Tax=Dryococelus australis TaxID=614101 RepID=A0ABQ9H0F6_9NEOP|nr:hypothetical protein PR048_022221 [Dryococelus australis]
MVSRREKLSRTFFRTREQTFHKQVAVLSSTNYNLTTKEVEAVIQANHGPSIYDRLYSQPLTEDQNQDFDLIVARIAGNGSPAQSVATEEKSKTDLNGLLKSCEKKVALDNPYKRFYFNGASRRRSSLYGSMSSGSETDTAARAQPKLPAKERIPLDSTASSTEEEEKTVTKLPVRKRTPCSRKNSTSGKTVVHAKTVKKKLETSSEDDKKPRRNSWKSPRNKTLHQMERELSDKMGSCTDESDELLPIKATKNEPQKINKIYSDSDSEVSLKRELSGGERNDDKSASNTPSDSQQHIVRTKAAMKEFSAGTQTKIDKSDHKNSTKQKVSKKVKAIKDTEMKEDEIIDEDDIEERSHSKSSKKKEYDPTDLIVPQRQAAKKATESIRSSQGRTKEQIQMLFEHEVTKTSPPAIEEHKLKPKAKPKAKEVKGSKDLKSNDIYEFEKDITEPDAQEILAYVPQRQAAKKAAAHIKSGMTKPVPEPDSEGAKQKKDVVEALKGKKEPETVKSRRESESEKKSPIKSDDSKEKSGAKYVSSSSTSSSTSSSDDSTSSSSESEDEEEVDKIVKSPIKSPKKDKVDKDVTADKKPSERVLPVETVKDDKKTKTVQAQEKRVPDKRVDERPFLDKGTESTSSSSTSSDEDSDENNLVRKKAAAESEPKSKNDGLSTKSKSHQHNSSVCASKPTDQNDERVASGSKSVGRKFKKAPDKKLKTSDRRPELEFQPPIAEGSEPFHAKEKLDRGKKLESNDGDWGRNIDSRSRDLSISKDRSDVSRSAISSRGEHDSPGKRNRSRSSRVEEQAPIEGSREGESAEERSPKKVQHKPDGRKKKPNETEKVSHSQSAEVCRETVGQSRSHRPPEDHSHPVSKERTKPSEHVPPSVKKAEKNLGEKMTADDTQKLDAKVVGLQSKSGSNTKAVSPQSDRESHVSQLEKEIAERKAEKAEKDATFKRSSRLSIDQLFEKRDKRIDRNKERETSSQIDKPLSEKSNQKLFPSKELIKSVVEDNFKRHTSPKEDFRGKFTHSTSVTGKGASPREDLKKASKDLVGVENSINTNKNDIKGIEKDCIVNKATKFNSVITSSKENIPEKKDTVIKKVEKHSTSDKTDSYLSRNDHRNSDKHSTSDKTDSYLSRNDHRNSDVVDKKEIIEIIDDYIPNDNRRNSSESASSISTESDEKNKKNARPMPRCKKKALGILSEIDLTQENMSTDEKEENEVVALDINIPKPEEVIPPPSEITVVDNKLQSIDEVKEVVPTPPLSNTSQSYGPENIVILDQNTVVGGNSINYPLPSQTLVGNEFQVSEPVSEQVPEPVTVEPKKVTSRTSSLNDPSYQHRSIFSPQQPSKDTSVAELFDFGNEILAVDETVHGDGFSIARDTEEIMRAPPVTFSFNSDFLFKEDSKEDSARETLNLVEKLRLEYAKKSTNSSSQADGQENNCIPSSVQDDSVIQLDDITDEKPEVPPIVEIIDPSPHESKEEKSVEIMEPKTDVPSSVEDTTDKGLITVETNISISQPHEPVLHHHTDEQGKSDGSSYNNPYEYQSCGMQVEGHKASVPGREKLDRSSTDERWVPPSMDFIPQQQHMSIMSHHYEHIPPSVDCTPAPSPYTDLRARAKWADHEVLPERRSSSSSISSSSSSSHREDMEPSKRDDLHLPPHTPGADLSSYPGLHPGIPYPPCALSDAPPFHPYSEASPFVGPMLFPPTCSQLPPFSSPGPAMFAPFGPSFAAPHSLLQPPPKPPEEAPLMPQPCVAAFTSSSHNMALTAAMVSPPPPVPTPGLLNQEQSPGSNITPASFAPVPDQIQHISMTMSPVQNSQGTLELNHSHPPVTPLPPSSFPPTSLAPVPVPPTSQTPQVPSAPFQMPAIPPPPAPPPPVPVSSSLPPPAHHPPESPAPKSASTGTAAGKKSPAKPTRSSARVTSQQGKSPAKSPGKSPRQLEVAGGKIPAHGRVRDSGGSRRGMSKVAVNRAMYNQPRGGSRRGRGRGRGQHVQHFNDADFLAGNTIHSKLVGTVYDFDDDAPSENVENLRAMRERRRSTDVHDRKLYDSTFLPHDSSHSSKFVSSQQSQNSKLRTSYGSEVRTLRSSSPMSDRHSSSVGEDIMQPSPPISTNTDRIEHFPDVQPLLPGPVDMRTYSSSYEPNSSNNSSAYHNNLFATSAAERVADIVEDLEEELHLTLPAKSLASSKTNETIQKQTEEFASGALPLDSTTNNKVSLSDSRNQLKVKIKGPFLDANYTASAGAPLSQQQPSLPAMSTFDGTAASSLIPAATGSMSSAATSGTSNLRRMRKKELLRQYCSQDMNMDDPATVSVTGHAMTPTAAPLVNRTVITIPKAVASMTTIPTREDYKAVVDANMEKKRRKEKASLSTSLIVPRKLRHLDEPHAAAELMERRRSVGTAGNNTSSGTVVDGNFTVTPVRGRGRAMRPAATVGQAPKLKIKFGNSIIGPQDSEMVLEEKRLRVRPPKKRLMSSVPKPSVEELKRESMKYRRKVMADFDEAEKKQKKVVSSKKHKQRHLDTHQVQVIENAEKLIIRINRASKGGSASAISSGGSVGGNDGSSPSAQTDAAAAAAVAAAAAAAAAAASSRTSAAAPPSEDVSAAGGADKQSHPPSASAPVDGDNQRKESPLLNVRTCKVTPIRLKLARCQEGYVMKEQSDLGAVSEAPAAPTFSEQSRNGESSNSTLPITKGCEVR